MSYKLKLRNFKVQNKGAMTIQKVALLQGPGNNVHLQNNFNDINQIGKLRLGKAS